MCKTRIFRPLDIRRKSAGYTSHWLLFSHRADYQRADVRRIDRSDVQRTEYGFYLPLLRYMYMCIMHCHQQGVPSFPIVFADFND